jgi:outer membrane protein assembly factor BamB
MFYAVTISERNTQSDVTASVVNRNGTQNGDGLSPDKPSSPILASMTYGDTVTITFNKSNSVTSSMTNLTASLLSNDQNSWSFVGKNGNSCNTVGTVKSSEPTCTMTLKFQPTKMNTTKGTGDIGKIGQLFLNLSYTFNNYESTIYTSQIKTAYYQFDDPIKWKTRVPTGGNPIASKLNLGPLLAPDGKSLYITKYGSYATTQLKTSDGTATGVSYTQSDYYTQLMPTLSKDGTDIYLASYANRGAITKFDEKGAVKLVRQYNIPIFYNMSLSPDEKTLYIPLNTSLGLLNTSDFSASSFNLTSQINTDVIVASDGTVYFGANYRLANGSRFNYLYAIDPANRKDPKWLSQTKDDSLIGTPVLASDDKGNKVIYILTGLGKLYSIDPKDGTQTWISAQTISNGTGDLSSGPTRAQYTAIGQDGTIYIGDNSGVFYAINPSDGSKKRSAILSTSPSPQLISVPAIDKDESGKDAFIYVSSYDNNLYALTTSGLSKKWVYPIGGIIYQPIIDEKNGLLYAMSSDGNLYALKIRPQDTVTMFKKSPPEFFPHFYPLPGQ